MSRRIIACVVFLVLATSFVGCQEFGGKRHFCPSCGEDTSATADQCEACGLEFEPIRE